jgi:hypothetical protein
VHPETTIADSDNSMTTVHSALFAFGLGVAVMANLSMGNAATDPAGVVPIVGESGHPPTGFRPDRTGKGTTGLWIIVSDPTGDGGRALKQVNPDRTDYRFPLAIYQAVSASDVDASVRFKSEAGEVDRAGGIAIRVGDADNYYVARANALEDNVNFYRVVRGVRQQIRGIRTKVTSDEWHTLGLRAVGNQFTVMFDGKVLFTAEDATFAGPGKVGLWTKADSITRFDKLTIHVLH